MIILAIDLAKLIAYLLIMVATVNIGELKNHLSEFLERVEGGEEIVVAAFAQDGGTVVNGSSYMFDQQVARFLSTLAPAA